MFSLDIIQGKYIELISDRLVGFSRKSEREYNFRCCFCGDSKKSELKKRGWLVRKGSRWFYYCFNCSISLTFDRFLEYIDKGVYGEYVLEVMQNRGIESKVYDDVKEYIEDKEGSDELVSLDKLPYSHEAYRYVKSRCISDDNMKYIYYTESFGEYIKRVIPGKYDDVSIPDVGIVFKLRDLDYNVTGFQIRNIKAEGKANRFMTCSIGDSHGYFYCRRIDKNRVYIVVEGPMDALSIENGIAVLNSSLYKFKNDIGLDCIYFNDQEPYNREVDKQIRNCIDAGLRTVLLGKEYFGMDINDIRRKYGDVDIESLAKDSSYSGIEAKIEYSKWKNQ